MDKDYLKAIQFMPKRLKSILLMNNGKEIQEIRLRIGRPLCVTVMGKEYFVNENGEKTSYGNPSVIICQNDIDETFRAVVEYSVHSFSKELKNGYVTIEGGHRVGICGTAVCGKDGVETIKNISAMNFRIAREFLGSADKISEKIFSRGLFGTLIIGPPSSAKTTVLRDLCRQLGNRVCLSVIDERSEIAAAYHGIPQNDVGMFTDVFDSYPKKEGIITALKVMSPKIIAVDELGSEEDCLAVEQCMNCGVKILATAHAGSIEEIKARKHIWNLCKERIFEKIVLLGSDDKLGKILEVYEVKDIA